MGVNQYLQQAYNTEAFKSMVSAEELEMISQLPTWYTAVFAIAVFAGALGCILLLLRKKLAYFVLLLSLISVLFQMGYITFSINMANIMTPFIVIAAVLLVLFSKHSKKKNWIN